jgi:hypothetical protein
MLKVHPKLFEYRKYQVDNIGVPFEMRVGYPAPPLTRSLAVSKIDEAVRLAIEHGTDVFEKQYEFGNMTVDNRWVFCTHYEYKTEHCLYDAPNGDFFLITISDKVITNLEVIPYPMTSD